MSNPEPWIALADTPELPISKTAFKEVEVGLNVRNIALPYKPLSKEETEFWTKQLSGVGGILLRSGYITEELLKPLEHLKVVAVHGAGVDPVDVDACTRRGVWVTNTPGANADAVAEITIGLMLSMARQNPQATNKVTTEKAWDNARHIGTELKDKTLGLLGLGQIGQRVAKIAKAFGMNVIAYDPGLQASKITKKGSRPVSLEELANHSDFLSLHAPAIDATKHIISRDFLGKMKTSSKLINCSRGSLVDEQALAEALNNGHLSGAALDVLDGEPPDPNSPLFDAPNVLMTPHMAGSTRECLETIANTAMQDIVRVLNGKKPLHSVNTPSIEG